MLEVGKTCYFVAHNQNGAIETGTIVKETAKFYSIKCGSKEFRKMKKNTYENELALKADVIARANYWLGEEFGITIPEAYRMFEDVIQEYPEKFI